MRAALSGYCLGIYLLSWAPSLEYSLALLILSAWGCVMLAATLLRSVIACVFICGLGLGLLWHWGWATERLRHSLPPELEGADLVIQGMVTGIPQLSDFGQRFDFRVLPVKDPGPLAASDGPQKILAGSKLQLNYFGGSLVSAGQSWQLQLRLKQRHGFANPGGYNREAYLFRQGYAATGYVRNSALNIPLDTSGRFSAPLILSWRHGLLSRLQPLLEQARYRNLMLALILGERSQLNQQHWDLFTATGTNHLFVISGLHIGLIAMLCFRLGTAMLKYLPPTVMPWPAQRSAAILAVIVTLVYSVMAGWGLPAQRASTMVVLFLTSYLSARKLSLSLRFVLALALVLSLDPLAGTSMGFWLSFTAVGALLFFALPLPEALSVSKTSLSLRSVWSRYLRPQWLVFVALYLPLVLLLGQVSLIAPLANILSIPVVGLLLVPLLLLASLGGLLYPELAAHLFAVADSLLHVVILLLETLASGSGILSSQPMAKPQIWLLLFLVPGVFLFLLPRRVPYRGLLLPLLLPVWLIEQGTTETGLRVDVLDVGQGLAVLVRTRKHALLYDTGPGNAGAWDAGEAIVLPVLASLGVPKLDRIIVSHSDSDHAGGLDSVLSRYPDSKVLLGSPAATLPGHDSSPCVAGDAWIWDGVEFAVLYPQLSWRDQGFPVNSNNQSCVLKISSAEFSVLLPGDIDAEVEKQLVLTQNNFLRSSVLFAPHHGSNTSSSYALLKQVAAKHVIVASGYGNGFGHPTPAVVVKHSQMGSQIHNTASTGMISLRGSVQGRPLNISHYRRDHQRYWAWSGNPALCRYC